MSKHIKYRKTRVLIAWKGRFLMENSKIYNNSDFDKIYSDFCHIIHYRKDDEVSTFKLRLNLIKIVNYNQPFRERVSNFFTYIFSKRFNLSDIDIDKIMTAWELRLCLEKNRKFIYTREIRRIYKNLSKIMHGELIKFPTEYLDSCIVKIDNFFNNLEKLYTYKLLRKRISISLQSIDKLREMDISINESPKDYTILFFKSTCNNRRIAIVEKEPNVKIYKDRNIIISKGSSEIGVYRLIDSTNYHTFIYMKKFKVNDSYQLYFE